MDVKDYCGAMSTELTAWKAKMYDKAAPVSVPG